jgi:hypothetical protein
MATLRCGDRQLPLKFTNHFLAHLQVAVHRRFKKAGGFFLTGTLTNTDGQDVTVSHWLNRLTPLEFEYDIRDVGDVPRQAGLKRYAVHLSQAFTDARVVAGWPAGAANVT